MSKHWYNNTISEILLTDDKPIPEGFYPGRIKKILTDEQRKKLATASGRCWYTNGKVQIYIKPGDIIPDGFYKGVATSTKEKIGLGNKGKKISEEQRKKLSIALSGENNPNYGKHLSEEIKKKISESEKGEKHWAYGKKQSNETILKKSNSLKGHILSDATKNKISISQKSKNSEERNEINRKVYESKKRNGTFKTSKYEEIFEKKLLEYFDSSDIHKDYRCDRYPFRCDFYIESIDTFIELNIHFSHGPHRYIGSDEDLKLINSWEEKVSKGNSYELAIDVFTKRDVEKCNVANQNNLNYITIYPNDFSNSDNIIKNLYDMRGFTNAENFI